MIQAQVEATPFCWLGDLHWHFFQHPMRVRSIQCSWYEWVEARELDMSDTECARPELLKLKRTWRLVSSESAD